MIKVVNKHCYHGEGVYVGRGRGSVLGNPYSHLPGTLAKYRTFTREEAIEFYREWLREQYRKGGKVREELVRLAKQYKQAGEMTLVCWCKPLPCHGDVLADAIEKIAARM